MDNPLAFEPENILHVLPCACRVETTSGQLHVNATQYSLRNNSQTINEQWQFTKQKTNRKLSYLYAYIMIFMQQNYC